MELAVRAGQRHGEVFAATLDAQPLRSGDVCANFVGERAFFLAILQGG